MIINAVYREKLKDKADDDKNTGKAARLVRAYIQGARRMVNQ